MLKAAFEAEIKQLKAELEKEHENAVVLEQKLQGGVFFLSRWAFYIRNFYIIFSLMFSF